MKHLKAKLMMSVISLMLATIMMTTASFAWFTISTAPEVSNVVTKMAANNNLEIMLDNDYAAGAGTTGADDKTRTLDPTTGAAKTTSEARNVYWGNLVDLEYFFNATDGTMKDLVLKPVVADEASGAITFKTPKFAKDGRIDDTKDLVARTADTGAAAGMKIYGEAAAADVKDCYAATIDLWLRTNVDNVTVNLGTAAVRGDSSSETGLGSWITNDKITVKISDGTTLYKAKHGTLDEGKYPLTLVTNDTNETAATISLTKNVAKKITVYIYMDGANLTNADFEAAAKDVMLNLQFVDAAGKVTAANALQVTEDNKYGRTEITVPAAYPAS